MTIGEGQLRFSGLGSGEFLFASGLRWGNLSGMPTASDIGLEIRPARPQAAPLLVTAGVAKHHAPQGRTNTLHASPDVSVEAVQFNREVSAMAQDRLRHPIATVPMGTADTSLLRWANNEHVR